MAYNSDGYIMIDFTEVDFRRTNQTIDGLYKRCVDVIGTNKFILVINANGRTPLPATCSFTNNQYVIDTCIYMFAISSNDNLFIRRNDVPASDIIDDSSISVDKTWSSNKIDTELDGKQNVLTSGNNITINNNVISAIPFKTFKYTGTGLTTINITIPDDLTVILGFAHLYNDNEQCVLSSNIIRNNTCFAQVHVTTNFGNSYTNLSNRVRWGANELKMISNNNSPTSVFNILDVEYTVYYL